MLITQTREWAFSGEDHSFQERLERRWHIAKDVYQVLEVLLRQALLAPSVADYSVAFDCREPLLSLDNSKGIKDYVRKILFYVQTQEAQKKLRFEAVQKLYNLTPQPDGVIEFSEEYQKLQKQIGDHYGDGPTWIEFLKLGYDGYFLEPTSPLGYGFERLYFKRGHDDMFKVLDANHPVNLVKRGRKPNLVRQLKAGLHPLRQYLTWLPDNIAATQLTKHPFFSVYAAVARAIYLPVFQNLNVRDHIEDDDGERSHRFYNFLSEKLIYSFSDDPTFRVKNVDLAKKLSATILSDRIKNSDFSEKVAAKIYQLRLINEELFTYLSEHNGFLSEDLGS